jgi:hypothetical protein
LKDFIKRLKKAPWSYKQPLTKVPNFLGMPVSDLFVWRCSSDWNTFFELTDIAGMFDDELEIKDQFAIICLFDQKGTLFHEEKLQIQRHKKITLDISTFLSRTKGNVGTFCIFHSHTPHELTKLGSFLAERGYLSYTYKNAPLRSFVHGNLDAIARLPDGEKQLLGTRSFLSRKYNLQHQLLGPANYDLAIVNPTFSVLNLTCSILSSDNNIIDVKQAKILPCGVGVFPVYAGRLEAYRLIITSHLVMARPLVFRTHNNNMDVFHG